MPAIDLNSDIGESFGRWRLGDSNEIFEHVTSANIACGFHAGDPSTIATTCRAARDAGAAIGAHVAYRDLAGFGRRFLDCSTTELTDDLIYQLGALEGFARVAGMQVRYVKPHGALYHAIVNHETHAQAVVDAIRHYNPELALLALPGALVLDKAEQHGIRGVVEAFADRAYNPDGSLVSRRQPGAVISDHATIADNMVRLAEEGVIIAHDGSRLNIDAASICVHGDSPAALAIAAAVKQALQGAGVSIQSFT